MWVRFRGQEDPLEDDMATHSSIPAWRIPWTEEPGGLQSIGSQTLLKQLSTHARMYFIYNHFLLCKIYFAYYIHIYRKVYVRTRVFICMLHVHIPCMYIYVCCMFPYVSCMYGHTYLCVCWAYMNTCACCHMCMSLNIQVHMRVYSHTHQSQVDDSS